MLKQSLVHLSKDNSILPVRLGDELCRLAPGKSFSELDAMLTINSIGELRLCEDDDGPLFFVLPVGLLSGACVLLEFSPFWQFLGLFERRYPSDLNRLYLWSSRTMPWISTCKQRGMGVIELGVEVSHEGKRQLLTMTSDQAVPLSERKYEIVDIEEDSSMTSEGGSTK